MSRLKNLVAFLRVSGPEREVAWRWLLRRPSIIDRKFRKSAVVRVRVNAGFQEVTINGELFVWPENASTTALLQIASELQNPNHPNQYLWGPTQISKGDIVLDLGACEGSFAARATLAGAKVIAVEPSKTMSATIARMFRLRRLPEPTIVRTLLGGAPADLHFVENQQNPGKSGVVSKSTPKSYPIKVLTLDMLVNGLGISRLDFIKCDAEGADVDIIKSGIETLRRFTPKLAICTYHRDQDFGDLYEFLKPLGYKILGKGLLHAPTKIRVVMLHAWQ